MSEVVTLRLIGIFYVRVSPVCGVNGKNRNLSLTSAKMSIPISLLASLSSSVLGEEMDVGEDCFKSGLNIFSLPRPFAM